MKREHFIRLVEEVLDSIPTEFRQRIHNLAVLVEDRPRPPKRPLSSPWCKELISCKAGGAAG